MQLSMVRAALLVAALGIARIAFAQTPGAVPIRAVAPISATTTSFRLLDQVREIAGGRLIVNDGVNRELAVFDPTLQQHTVLADTAGTGSMYPRFGRLIPYLADSTLFYRSDARSLELIDPDGKSVRIVALPRPQDFNSLTSGGPVATDDRGRLIYQGRAPLVLPPSCRLPDEPAAPPPATRPASPDSVSIIRADFDTRTADTIARAKITAVALSFPITTTDARCIVTAAKIRVNPSLPATDSWTVTAKGSVAIVRGFDYHVDWIDSDGTHRSTPRLPFDWRRITDADKQAKIDSARRIIDSLTEKGGFRLRACGRGTSFMTAPPEPAVGADVTTGGRGGGSGRGGSGLVGAAMSGSADAPVRAPECQTVIVTPEFAPLDSMADYVAPIRERSVHADLDGNVWVLPTTSASAKGGLLYDVVSPAGQLVERVQLPGGRDVVGFGRDGIVYLARGEFKTGYVIEKVRIVR